MNRAALYGDPVVFDAETGLDLGWTGAELGWNWGGCFLTLLP
jgi:hypothetical protein